jgi:hypothetical protein
MKKLLLILICITFASGCIVKSEGERVGTISKFSEKGIFVSTWEGDAILGGVGASGNSENTWKFTVEDSAVAERVKKFHKTGKLVVLKYRQEMFVAPWRGDTHYFVEGVEFASN